MGRVDKGLEALGTAVGGLHGKRLDAVVAPVASPGEGCHGHDLQGRDPEGLQLGQARDGHGKGALGSEGAHVQLIEDQGLGCGRPESGNLPGVTFMVHQGRGAVHALGLVVRGRVRSGARIVEEEAVLLAVGQARYARGPQAARSAAHGQPPGDRSHELQLQAGDARRPDAEGEGAAFDLSRAVGQVGGRDGWYVVGHDGGILMQENLRYLIADSRQDCKSGNTKRQPRKDGSCKMWTAGKKQGAPAHESRGAFGQSSAEPSISLSLHGSRSRSAGRGRGPRAGFWHGSPGTAGGRPAATRFRRPGLSLHGSFRRRPDWCRP